MDVPWWLWSAVLVLVEITDVAHIPTPVSLAVVTLILIVSVAASTVVPREGDHDLGVAAPPSHVRDSMSPRPRRRTPPRPDRMEREHRR